MLAICHFIKIKQTMLEQNIDRKIVIPLPLFSFSIHRKSKKSKKSKNPHALKTLASLSVRMYRIVKGIKKPVLLYLFYQEMR